MSITASDCACILRETCVTILSNLHDCSANNIIDRVGWWSHCLRDSDGGSQVVGPSLTCGGGDVVSSSSGGQLSLVVMVRLGWLDD